MVDSDRVYHNAHHHYSRGEYRSAVKLLDRAIERTSSPALLGLRASCLEKLKDLPGALKDTKRTIQLVPGDPNGYLCAARILQQMGKIRTAFEISKLGLDRVKHVGQGYTALKRLHDKLQSTLWPPKHTDPLTVLPRELVLMILGYLDFAQCVTVSRVSKQWMQFIRSEPGLWRHLDLSRARSKVRKRFISTCINSARKNIRAVTLHQLWDFKDSLVALVKSCPLEKVTLMHITLEVSELVKLLAPIKNLKELQVTGENPRDGSLCTFAQAFQSLELLRLNWNGLAPLGGHVQIPGLRTLHLCMTLPIQGEQVKALPHFAPALQSLIIEERNTGTRPSTIRDIDLSACTHLQHLYAEMRLTSGNRLKLPPTLQTLHLDTMGLMDDLLTADRTPQPGLYLPELVYLSLTIPGIELEDAIQAFHVSQSGDTSQANISEVAFMEVNVRSTDSLSSSRFDSIERLSLKNAACLDDDALSRLLARFSHLRFLDLSHSSVTGVGVKEAVRGGVKALVLQGCSRVARDAVDWARSQGVKVYYPGLGTKPSGKKVRYGSS